MFPRRLIQHEAMVCEEEEEGDIIIEVDGGSGSKAYPCLVLTSDPKPRLRWTADLHHRFVDAVTQLGGPTS